MGRSVRAIRDRQTEGHLGRVTGAGARERPTNGLPPKGERLYILLGGLGNSHRRPRTVVQLDALHAPNAEELEAIGGGSAA